MIASEQPYFTVVVPTFNRPGMLADAVQSVLAQTCADFELIVVDDAGPAPASMPVDPRVRLLRNDTNIGKSASINRALALARGRVIAFLDDDDAWAPERLAHARELHEEGADVVVCGTRGITQPAAAGGTPVPRVAPRLNHHMGATSVVAEMCPDFDVDFRAVEDIEWMVRVQEHRPRIMAVQSRDFLWRVHRGERHLNGVPARIRGHRQLLEKHAAYYAAHRAEYAERLHRVGLLYYRLGMRRRALRFALSSLRVRPSVDAAQLVARVGLPQRVNLARLGEVIGGLKSRRGSSPRRGSES